ncbi:hypothetical protein BB558_002968 [Smittium angustum]|uniref:DH domain-containing protein n=1 Tax=Smittium angustum TaxID=133377 RepID=A0A2U1J764_SMIAN|nr:hypothetical protein BB558_002968 [Smittium angustum]
MNFFKTDKNKAPRAINKKSFVFNLIKPKNNKNDLPDFLQKQLYDNNQNQTENLNASMISRFSYYNTETNKEVSLEEISVSKPGLIHINTLTKSNPPKEIHKKKFRYISQRFSTSSYSKQLSSLDSSTESLLDIYDFFAKTDPPTNSKNIIKKKSFSKSQNTNVSPQLQNNTDSHTNYPQTIITHPNTNDNDTLLNSKNNSILESYTTNTQANERNNNSYSSTLDQNMKRETHLSGSKYSYLHPSNYLLNNFESSVVQRSKRFSAIKHRTGNKKQEIKTLNLKRSKSTNFLNIISEKRIVNNAPKISRSNSQSSLDSDCSLNYYPNFSSNFVPNPTFDFQRKNQMLTKVINKKRNSPSSDQIDTINQNSSLNNDSLFSISKFRPNDYRESTNSSRSYYKDINFSLIMDTFGSMTSLNKNPQNYLNLSSRFSFSKSFSQTDLSDKKVVIAKRMYAIRDLLITENNFKNKMNIIKKIWAKPLINESNLKKLFSHKILATLFYKIDTLQENSKQIYKDIYGEILRNKSVKLENRDIGENILIGDIFTSINRCWGDYIEYMENYGASLYLLNQLLQNQTFLNYHNHCMYLEANEKQSLKDLLYMPIQHIIHYPILLRTILQNTSPTHPDYSSLKFAIKTMTILVNNVKLSRNANRKLVGEYFAFEQRSKLSFRLFLFNDYLVIGKLVETVKINDFNNVNSDWVFHGCAPLNRIEMANLNEKNESTTSVLIIKSRSQKSIARKNQYEGLRSKSETNLRKNNIPFQNFAFSSLDNVNQLKDLKSFLNSNIQKIKELPKISDICIKCAFPQSQCVCEANTNIYSCNCNKCTAFSSKYGQGISKENITSNFKSSESSFGVFCIADFFSNLPTSQFTRLFLAASLVNKKKRILSSIHIADPLKKPNILILVHPNSFQKRFFVNSIKFAQNKFSLPSLVTSPLKNTLSSGPILAGKK